MIQIERIYITETENKTRCICETSIDGIERNIWFEVDKEYGDYLCCERADAYIIGLLSFAMREDHDIVSKIPVTEELLYNIREVVIPELSKHSVSMKCINIVADAAESIKQGDAVGTALSCGADSFWSINKHLKSEYKKMDLTHVCINNVGAFNECYSGYGAEKVKNERYEIAKQVAKELNIKLVMTDSNFADAYPQNHLLTCSYSNVFAIYMLQKLWRVYYVCSNGIDFATFSLESNDTRSSEQSELFLLQYLSSDFLKLYCDGGELSRLEKMRDIADTSYVKKYLHVCQVMPYNCGICSKCRRTLLALDALGKVDEFGESFDIDYYRSHIDEYYAWLWKMHVKGDLMNKPVYKILKKRKSLKSSGYYAFVLINEKIKWHFSK